MACGDDKETRTDALLRRVKDHPVAAPVIVVAIGLAAVAVFISQVDDARKVFWRPENPPVVIEPKSPSFVPPEAPKATPEAPKAQLTPRSESPVQRSDRIFVGFQQYGTPAVQKHGTPGSWSLT
jgi:hypothetical protein